MGVSGESGGRFHLEIRAGRPLQQGIKRPEAPEGQEQEGDLPAEQNNSQTQPALSAEQQHQNNLLHQYENASEKAGNLHEGARRSLIGACVFGALGVANAITPHLVQDLKVGSFPPSLTIPVEIALTGYNVGQYLKRNRRANIADSQAATFFEMAKAAGEPKLPEPSLENDPAYYGLPLSIEGERARVETHVVRILEERGILPQAPGERASPTVQPTPPPSSAQPE